MKWGLLMITLLPLRAKGSMGEVYIGTGRVWYSEDVGGIGHRAAGPQVAQT